jgi:hypothetical protein
MRLGARAVFAAGFPTISEQSWSDDEYMRAYYRCLIADEPTPALKEAIRAFCDAIEAARTVAP